MKLNSSVFEDQGYIPKKYTCDGEDINPPLKILEVPDRADSLVLIVDDPDAPNGPFVHWTMWNLDPDTKKIKEGSVPEGAEQGVTDFGNPGYGGPCPPSGTHRYFFKLYAIEGELDLSTNTTKEELEASLKERLIDSDELVGKYSRE